jgi:hypothetical protein
MFLKQTMTGMPSRARGNRAARKRLRLAKFVFAGIAVNIVDTVKKERVNQ